MRSDSRPSSFQETAVRGLVAEIATDHRVQAALRISAHFDLPLTDREVEVFDATIHEIVQNESVPVRARVAASLAHVSSGPARTVLFLAQDESEEVAAPLLRHSPLVPEPVLVTVAWSRGQAHLAAIAGRRSLPAPVSDIVVARGSWPVLRTVAANDTAQLADYGLNRLVQLSRGDGHITVALAKRSDVPASLRRGLFDQFKTLALVGRPSLMGEDSGIDLGLGDDDPLSPPALRHAEEWLATLPSPGQADIARCLQFGEAARVVALVGALADEPVPAVAHVFRTRQLDAAILLLRIADLDWPLAERLLAWHFGPDARRDIGNQRTAYGQLSRRSAERALRFLQFRRRTQVIPGGRGPEPAPPALPVDAAS